MLLRHVTFGEIVDAIEEIMGDCEYTITRSSRSPMDLPYNGGYYVRVNNCPETVLLYYADTFYQKLNDYCAGIEQEAEWNKTDDILQERYPFESC